MKDFEDILDLLGIKVLICGDGDNE